MWIEYSAGGLGMTLSTRRGGIFRMSALRKNPGFSNGRVSKTQIFRLNADNLIEFFFVRKLHDACTPSKADKNRMAGAKLRLFKKLPSFRLGFAKSLINFHEICHLIENFHLLSRNVR